MDIGRILDLAHDAALTNWNHHRERLEALPTNIIRQHQEANAWTELKQLELIITEWKKGKE